MSPKNLQKIIIDTDAGHDDVLAMLLLIKSNLFDIQAITTVAGNSTIDKATRNTRFTTKLVQHEEIPVFSGSAKPLKRKLVTAKVHGKSGLDGAQVEDIKYRLTNNAYKKIIEIVKQNPNKVTILTLGPLTNVARALKEAPEIDTLVKEIIIMGGAINIPGNQNRVAEFNISVDPDAADIVFRSKIKKILVPIDICEDMLVHMSDFNKMKSSVLYEPIAHMMESFLKGIKQSLKVNGLLIYDAVAAYYLIDKKSFSVTNMDIVVETKGEHTYGMTVVDKRTYSEKQNNVGVTLRVNKNQFKKDFFRILR